jgi:hypothetical protein
MLIGLLAIDSIISVCIIEVGFPILSFSIYNPDKKVIEDFSKNELQLYGNTMFALNSLKNTLAVLVTISQIDLALCQVLFSELTSLVTIRMLLDKKEFKSATVSHMGGEGVSLLSFERK